MHGEHPRPSLNGETGGRIAEGDPDAELQTCAGLGVAAAVAHPELGQYRAEGAGTENQRERGDWGRER